MKASKHKATAVAKKVEWVATWTASYLEGFRCIGSACEDNCCVGWDVDIDQLTFKKYQGVQDEVLTGMFKRHVHKNAYCYSPEVDYGVVKLTKQKQCPFLDEQRLCRIQARLGEAYLSNVCHTFPRYTNRIDGVYEHSATGSCPEIARKLLLNPEGVRFIEGQEVKGRCIVTNDLATSKVAKSERRVNVLCFKELRTFSLKILQNRDFRLWERLLILGYLCKTLESLENRGLSQADLKNEVQKILLGFEQDIKAGTLQAKYGNVKSDVSAQMTLLQEVSEKLNVFSEVDSTNYIEFTKKCLLGLEHDGKKGNVTSKKGASAYGAATSNYYEPYMMEREYILENFLVNFVFKNLFPYSETYSFTEAYMTLVIRYALVRMNLIGLSAYYKGLNDEQVVAYLQAFSKTVEHHRTYLGDMVWLLGSKGYGDLNKLAILLKN